MKLEIHGARVDRSRRRSATRPGSIFIADGKIAALDKAPDGFRADETIDAKGLVACPGLVDLSARLREPGFEYKATLESEMRAAVAGGVTTLACPPDTDPPLDEPGLVEMLTRRAASLDQRARASAGRAHRGPEGRAARRDGRARRGGLRGLLAGQRAAARHSRRCCSAMRYAATFGFTVWLRPQDARPRARRRRARRRGRHAPGPGAHSRRSPRRSRCARSSSSWPATGARVHLARLSSAAGVALVRAGQGARRRRSPATWASTTCTCATATSATSTPTAASSPPLRDPSRPRRACAAALADGTIDAVCSDHTPVDDDAKQVPFAEAEPGATGLELLLPLTLQWGSEAGLKLAEALARGHHRAGAHPRRRRRARSPPGAAADICLFDPDSALGRAARRRSRARARTRPSWASSSPAASSRTLVGGRTVHSA